MPASTLLWLLLTQIFPHPDVDVTDVYARGVNVNLTPLTSNRGALATDARGCSQTRSDELWPYVDPGGYIGAVTRMGVRFRGVNVTDVYARGVNVNLTPLTSNRGALATDARGCSRLALLVRAPASRTGIPGSRPAPTSCGSMWTRGVT